MHSEGQNKEGSINVGTRLESLTLEAFQACLRKNNNCESGIQKCFLGFYVSKNEQFYFIFYLTLLQEQVSPLVQLRTFLSAAPCMRKFRGSHTPSFSNPFYFIPLLMSIRTGGENLDVMKIISFCKVRESTLTLHQEDNIWAF